MLGTGAEPPLLTMALAHTRLFARCKSMSSDPTRADGAISVASRLVSCWFGEHFNNEASEEFYLGFHSLKSKIHSEESFFFGVIIVTYLIQTVQRVMLG